MVEHKTDSGHTIGKEFPEQAELTANLTRMISNINSCSDLAPEEKKRAISKLQGITRKEMSAVIQTTGPKLAESIRALIGADRAS